MPRLYAQPAESKSNNYFAHAGTLFGKWIVWFYRDLHGAIPGCFTRMELYNETGRAGPNQLPNPPHLSLPAS